jgi:hypothetical protein
LAVFVRAIAALRSIRQTWERERTDQNATPAHVT